LHPSDSSFPEEQEGFGFGTLRVGENVPVIVFMILACAVVGTVLLVVDLKPLRGMILMHCLLSDTQNEKIGYILPFAIIPIFEADHFMKSLLGGMGSKWF